MPHDIPFVSTAVALAVGASGWRWALARAVVRPDLGVMARSPLVSVGERAIALETALLVLCSLV